MITISQSKNNNYAMRGFAARIGKSREERMKVETCKSKERVGRYEKEWHLEASRKGIVKATIGAPESFFYPEIAIMKKFLREPLLDAGCGYGRVLKHFKNITGVDISSEMLGEAKKTGKKVFKCSITDLHIFPDKTFNGVICNKVLFHLTDEDFLKSLREFHRVLRKDGRIFFGVPYIFDLRNFIFNLRGILHLFRGSVGITRTRSYTKRKIISMVKKANFSPVYFDILDYYNRTSGIVVVAEKVGVS